MTDERLEGLALLFVHPDIRPTLDYTMLLLTTLGNGIVGYRSVTRPRPTRLEVGPVYIQSSN